MSSGVVYALKTRCLGASKSRVIRICVSVGSVTTAVPLLVTAISLLLPLEFFQHDIQSIEAPRPRPLVVLHPVMDRLERVTIKPVDPLPPFITHVHEPHLS